MFLIGSSFNLYLLKKNRMHCKCACWVHDQIKFLIVNVKRCEDFNNDEETENFRRRN